MHVLRLTNVEVQRHQGVRPALHSQEETDARTKGCCPTDGSSQETKRTVVGRFALPSTSVVIVFGGRFDEHELPPRGARSKQRLNFLPALYNSWGNTFAQ